MIIKLTEAEYNAIMEARNINYDKRRERQKKYQEKLNNEREKAEENKKKEENRKIYVW